MAKYKNIVITNSGLALIAAAHSGDTIEFTNIKVGSGVYNGAEVLEDMTDLKSVQHSFGISGITRHGTVVKVRSVLSNESVTEGYYITETGLYAKDSAGAEILFAVIIAEDNRADYFTAYLVAPQSITVEMYITVTGITEGVTFTASPIEGVYATVQDLEDFRVEVDALKKSVSDGKILVAGAITNKGINTATDATFATMASNIAAIKTNPTLQAKTATLSTIAQTILADTGYDGLSQVTVPAITGTAAAGNVLAGKTFSSAAGVNLTGTMVKKAPDYGDQITATGVNYGAGSGNATEYLYSGITNNAYYEGVNYIRTPANSIASAIDLQPYKIVSGYKVLGVSGTGGNKRYASGVCDSSNSATVSDTYYTSMYNVGSTSYSSIMQNIIVVTHGLPFTPKIVRLEWTVNNYNYVTFLEYGSEVGRIKINDDHSKGALYVIDDFSTKVKVRLETLVTATKFYFIPMAYGSLANVAWEAWE